MLLQLKYRPFLLGFFVSITDFTGEIFLSNFVLFASTCTLVLLMKRQRANSLENVTLTEMGNQTSQARSTFVSQMFVTFSISP